jgi:histone-lysine N-methyltransferase SETMAR
VKLKDILKEKRRGDFTKGVLFLHDKSPAHQTLATQKKLANLGFHCLDHTPYSPEVAPSVYHSFLGLMKQIKVRHFRPKRRSLLPQIPGWADKILILF